MGPVRPGRRGPVDTAHPGGTHGPGRHRGVLGPPSPDPPRADRHPAAEAAGRLRDDPAGRGSRQEDHPDPPQRARDAVDRVDRPPKGGRTGARDPHRRGEDPLRRRDDRGGQLREPPRRERSAPGHRRQRAGRTRQAVPQPAPCLGARQCPGTRARRRRGLQDPDGAGTAAGGGERERRHRELPADQERLQDRRAVHDRRPRQPRLGEPWSGVDRGGARPAAHRRAVPQRAPGTACQGAARERARSGRRGTRTRPGNRYRYRARHGNRYRYPTPAREPAARDGCSPAAR